MKVSLTKKDKAALLRVFSGICGDIAPGWFLIGFVSPSNLFVLTKSLALAIVFTWLAFIFEKRLR